MAARSRELRFCLDVHSFRCELCRVVAWFILRSEQDVVYACTAICHQATVLGPNRILVLPDRTYPTVFPSHS
eukprot:3958305-Amphidinium_carterae.1